MPCFDGASYRTRLIHVFRHLLRECGYLPDHVARDQIRRQVISRFRNHEQRGKHLIETLSKTGETRHVAVESLERKLKTAFTNLKTLRNANLGGQKSLAKVLLYAYGRTGKRKHELLAPLMKGLREYKVQESGDSGYILHLPVSPLFAAPELQDGQRLRFSISEKYEALRTLVESQNTVHRKNASSHIAAGKHTRAKPDFLIIPQYNMWLRPMPQKRAKNLLNRWVTKIQAFLLPPLPEPEWKHLQDLVFGRKPFRIVPRRKPLDAPEFMSNLDLEKVLDMDASDKDPEALAYRKPFATRYRTKRDDWLEDEDSMSSASLEILKSELGLSLIPIKRNQTDHPHTLTQRSLRRMYGKVFSHCCLLEEENKSYRITWGSTILNEKKTLLELDTLYKLVTMETSEAAN